MEGYQIEIGKNYCLGRFMSMASPCEILLDGQDGVLAEQLTQLAWQEAKRIEQKFSRYRDDNLLYTINHAKGRVVDVDDEYQHLLVFADQCYRLSDGLFDITSGILRKAWDFNAENSIPTNERISALLPMIGWEKVDLQNGRIAMPSGMELDFGGIGKEYAVDRVFMMLTRQTELSCLVNFGGDLRVNHPRKHAKPWCIGVEDPREANVVTGAIKMSQGALATSGDSKRFIEHNGKRYGHVLNPKTGWPIENGPSAVTVAAPTATQAGMLATFALLQGENAEAFLQQQGVEYWLTKAVC